MNMHKFRLFYLAGALAGVSSVCAQTMSKAHVEGVLQWHEKLEYVLLSYKDKGTVVCDTIPVSADGTFKYDVNFAEPTVANLFVGMSRPCSIFLENGKSTGMHIFSDASSLTVAFSGDNVDCNDFYKSFEALIYDYNRWSRGKIAQFKDFSEFREAYAQEIDSVKIEINNINSLAFRQYAISKIEGEEDEQLIKFLFRENSVKDSIFCKYLKSIDMNDLENIYLAMQYVNWYVSKFPEPENMGEGIYYLKTLETKFKNPDVINYLADVFMKRYIKKAPTDLVETYNCFLKMSSDEKSKEDIRPLYEHYSKMMPGAPAVDFDMTDTRGRDSHLKDFKGKALYVDIWATWCKGCVAEIPYMAKLVERYKGNDKIELISISMDRNQDAWKKKLKEDKPQWKQYVCKDEFKSALAQNYSIEFIPRFLLFDKDGNIVSLDAPAPSDSRIVEVIDKLIEGE